jgi:GNAT superfamily N-acetyltransferase
MSRSIRIATPGDVPAMFDIRVSVRENSATREGLRQAGITEQTVESALRTHGCGWIAENDGRAVGFSMADPRDGSVFALFVRPEFEGRGYGGALLAAAVDWLFARGLGHAWLEVGPETRAYPFYVQRGWIETSVGTNGDVVMQLPRCRDGSRTGV